MGNFRESLYKIMQEEELKINGDDIVSKLDGILDADGFDVEEDIPRWFIHFISFIQTRKKINETIVISNPQQGYSNGSTS